MRIKKSTMADLPRLLEIYRHARAFMAKTGNPKQWGDFWPPSSVIENDIKQAKSYVCIYNNKIAGTFFFDMGKDVEPTYKKITQGNWLNTDPYGVIHRLAAAGSAKGIGTFCISWCFEQCKHLRADTHPDNVAMKNLLIKLGFKKCGIIKVLHDDMPRLAFEKF